MTDRHMYGYGVTQDLEHEASVRLNAYRLHTFQVFHVRRYEAERAI